MRKQHIHTESELYATTEPLLPERRIISVYLCTPSRFVAPPIWTSDPCGTHCTIKVTTHQAEIQEEYTKAVEFTCLNQQFGFRFFLTKDDKLADFSDDIALLSGSTLTLFFLTVFRRLHTHLSYRVLYKLVSSVRYH